MYSFNLCSEKGRICGSGTASMSRERIPQVTMVTAHTFINNEVNCKTQDLANSYLVNVKKRRIVMTPIFACLRWPSEQKMGRGPPPSEVNQFLVNP